MGLIKKLKEIKADAIEVEAQAEQPIVEVATEEKVEVVVKDLTKVTNNVVMHTEPTMDEWLKNYFKK